MRTLALAAVLISVALTACRPNSPSEGEGEKPSFALVVPEGVRAAPGGTRVIELGLDARGGFSEQVTLQASVAAPLTVTVEGLRVSLTVPRDVPAGLQTIELDATSASGLEVKRSLPVEVLPAAQTGKTSPLHLRLDSLFYADGASVRATVDLAARPTPPTLSDVVFVSSDTNDVEHVAVRVGTGGLLETVSAVKVSASNATGVVGDGVLFVPPGGTLIAFFGIDTTVAGYTDLDTAVLSDFGVVDGARPGAPTARVETGLKTADEDNLPTDARPFGTILRPGSPSPVQLATKEVVLFHRDAAELQRYLAWSHGTLVRTDDVDGDMPFASLVEVNPSAFSVERLALARALAGETDDLLSSSVDAQTIYGFTLASRLDGFVVAVNPRLQFQSVPKLVAPESDNVNATMQMRGRFGVAGCIPGMGARDCTSSIPAVWATLDLFEADTRRVKVGVIDMGFAPNGDFRRDAMGALRECDFTSRSFRCGPDVAEGPPTVGGLLGTYGYHGTGVVTALGGMVDNGFGATGTGGQVVEPMLYKFDTTAYAFDIGRGITQALADGAGVINISAGYPCRVLTTVGPDFDLCSVEGRLGICAIITAAAHTAAVAFCTSPLAGIPIVGAAVCGGLLTAATIATDACLSTLTINTRSPMASAVNRAIAQGVPVVASAGNYFSGDTLPAELRGYLDLRNGRLESWQVIPASLPGVIAVGAVDSTSFANLEFFGDRVDIWAPTGSAYFEPGGASTIGATSGAAPYITGLIADMEALNPTLDPSRNTAADRSTAVDRMRRMLVETAFTDTQLMDRGFAHDGERRLVVNPLAAVRSASRGAQPDLAALGYDLTLNFSELDLDDDVDTRARLVTFDTEVLGTLLEFDSAPAHDADWLEVRFPSGGTVPLGSDITVRTIGIERPTLASNGMSLPLVRSMNVGAETFLTFRLVRNPGATAFVKVSMNSGDAVYGVTVATPVALTPTVAILDPVPMASISVCANVPVNFRAVGTYENGATVSTLEWRFNGVLQASTSPTTTFTKPPGTYTVDAASGSGHASVSVTFVLCTAQAVIVTPATNVQQYAPGSDANGFFLPVSFSGRALDASGNVIDPATLVFEWTTNRGDQQPGAPATGSQLIATGANPGSIRIYALGGSSGIETHTITLTVRQSAGGPVLSTDSVQVSVEWVF